MTSAHLLGASPPSSLPRARAHSTGSRPASVGATSGLMSSSVSSRHVEALARRAAEQVRLEFGPRAQDQPCRKAAAAAAEPAEEFAGSGGDGTGQKAEKLDDERGQQLRRKSRALARENFSPKEAELRRNSFNCMLVGSRQTGKRTIVECFVKLLAEFQLASSEFKREKMLSKLVECSGRIQELAERQQQAEQQAELEQEERESRARRRRLSGIGGHAAFRSRRRSRLNSWLGEHGSRLLNLSPSSRRRLHSLVGGGGGGSCERRDEQLSGDDQALASRSAGATSPAVRLELEAQEQNEQIQPCPTNAGPLVPQIISSNSSQVTLTGHESGEPERHHTGYGHLLASCGNKSDTNINYLSGAGLGATVADTQNRWWHQAASLQVPGEQSSSNNNNNINQLGMPTKNLRAASVQINRATGSELNKRLRRATDAQAHRQAQLVLQQEQLRRRRRSVVVALRRKRKRLLNLKQLNRRKWAVRFNTRRQLSDNLLSSLSTNHLLAEQPSQQQQPPRQPNSGAAHQWSAAELPDAFLVVYSIND